MHTSSKAAKTGLIGMSFAALGVVFGDIGTSPLYSINEIFFGKHHLELSRTNIMGLISVVLWALILIIAVKYVLFVLRADNEGEGGVFALLALLKRHPKKITAALVTILTFSAGLLFGDGIITPAISVLSAIEGLEVATPALASYVVPITIAILTGLFLIQRQGTNAIGKVFGPVILVWFVAIAALGLHAIVGAPAILGAINPYHAYHFIMVTHPYELLITIGAVMLVVTGGEALFADMGHFGRSPIRLSWFSVVMPCLMLNYLGQGAYLLSGQPVVGNNLFYSLVPTTLIYPMVFLAAFATIIASQALISGAFSLASQGIALGLLPRLRIKHTHEHHGGQIYLGLINWSLYVGCVALVLAFRSSTNLAAAYGLAVSIDMLITTVSILTIAILSWKWKPWAFLPFALFIILDIAFLSANSLKLLSGGYVPVSIGLILFFVMGTWRWGKAHVREAFTAHSTMTMQDLLEHKLQASEVSNNSVLVLTMHNPSKVEDPVPPLVELYIKKFKQIPRHLIILTVSQTKRPKEQDSKRLEITVFDNDRKRKTSVISINARFGFFEEPDVSKVIKYIAKRDDLTPNDDMKDWVVYAGRERIMIPRAGYRHILKRIRARLYAFMMRNAAPSYEYYGLGSDNRVSVELVPVRIQ